MNKQEKAVLIGVTQKGENQGITNEYLDELEFLALTAGAKTLKRFTQRLERPHPKTFIGEGKLQEVEEFAREHEVDMIIFDDELTPAQIKNIENRFNAKLLDRTKLILDIFAFRAQTAQAKTQVELAQCQYMLPRLTRLWTHHSRQKGGIGTKGPGEKELETDRRMIRNKISLLESKLKKIDKQNQTRRKNRDEKVRVSLVGYTNTGKSTLMNLLTKAGTLAEDKLFATLDATVRKVVHNKVPFLLSDTVGFIRKLPHGLIESFKSTLDEVREADVLVHIVDVSHPAFEKQIRVVQKTLEEMGVVDKPMLLVFNKIDKIPDSFFQKSEDADINGQNTLEDEENTGFSDDEHERINEILQRLETSYLKEREENVAFVSALKKVNIDLLREKVTEMVKERYYHIYPYSPYIENM